MFLSKSVSIISKSAVIRTTLPRVLGARSFTVGDAFGKKEKVEEDRYMRELEKSYIAKKKAEMAAKMAADEETEFADQIAPVMAEADVLLKKSGDSVSNHGLEALARWKLGL